MIARAVPPVRPAPPSTPALVGNKRPQRHRFHLADGRVLEGNLHRAPSTRLADHLSTLKGWISVTDVQGGDGAEPMPYLVLNTDHIVQIDEIPEPVRGPHVAAGAGG